MSTCSRNSKLARSSSALILALAAQSALAGNPASFSIFDTPIGVTPRYLGYNMGHYMLGSNTTAWTQYSGVNAYRVWAAPTYYEPTDDQAPYGDGVTTLAQFDSRKTALRVNPDSSTYINWSYFTSRFDNVQTGTNRVRLDYILPELRNNGIEPILQISRTESYDYTGWGGKWEQWQHFYTMAYWAAKNFDVQKFQMYNEPDQSASTITVTEWESRLRTASDAVKSAIEDVNRIYGKSLVAQMAGPTAKDGASTFNTWGQPALVNNRKDFADRAQSVDNLNIYDLHRYNAIGTTYASDVNTVQTQTPFYNPSGQALPVTFTEFNRYASGTFADRADSLDTPQIFSEYATIYTGAMSKNVLGMYAFKFSQTMWDPGNGTGQEPQKTGHYYVNDDAVDPNNNITGATQAAEVARLIAKGFKGERPRLNQTGSAWDINYESASAVDNSRENYHYLSINRGVSATYDVTLNLSNIDVAVGQVVEVQEVSANHHGAVSRYLTVPANKTLTFTQPVTSVYMLSIPKGQSVRQQVTLAPVADAQVSNATPLVNYGALSTASVARSATTTADQATYLKFNLGANDKSKVSRAVLSLTGANAVDSTLATLHVYGILNDSWNELTINWSNAPDLAGASDAKLANVGTDVFPVGQLTWNNAASEWGIDVTDFVRKHPNADLSFVVIREQRFTNDGAGEIARIDLNTREAASGSPKLALSLYSQPHHFWNTNFNANFSAASSWDSGAAPNSAGAVAVLGDFITSPHTVTLDASATLGTLSFQSWNTYTVTGAAARTLTLSNPTANSAINVFQGSHVLSTPLALASATDINTLTGTTLTIDKSISGSAALNKLGPGTLILSPTSIKFTGALRINQGLVRVGASGATGVSHLSSLSIAAGAALDMTDNDLIVDSTPFTTIRNYVLAGVGATAGITSSTSTGATILALLDNALVGASTWSGESLTPTSIVGKYTYFGDMNIDGQVTGDDYTVIDASLNTDPVPGLEWLSGDANLDGIVTGDDYTVIDANLGLGAGMPLASSRINPTPVPEPAALSVLLLPFALPRRRCATIR